MKPVRCKHGWLLTEDCNLCGHDDHGIDPVKFQRELKLKSIREQSYQKYKNLINANIPEKEAFIVVINDIIVDM